jgi:long-chain acyl-CoA synthetase
MNLMFCLRRARQLYGSKVASYREQGPMTWTELYDRSHRAAAFLRDLGIQKGDRVAVWMLNSHEYLELYFATMIAGIVIVPLNTRWHESDVAFTLSDSESVALIVDDRFAPLVASVPRPRHVIYAGGGACPEGMIAMSHGDSTHQFEEPHEDDLAGLFYTSGTTGGPKGVMLTHRNLWSNVIHTMMIRIVEGVWLHAAPMFHLADMGAMYTVTITGAAHAFLPVFDPEVFMQTVERFRVTDTVLVPTMLNMLIHHPAFEKYDLSTLHNFTYGASPMPLPLLKEAMHRLPGARFRQGYGMTETSPLLTVLDYEDHFGDAVTSAGKPVPGVEVRVVDELDRDVPVGESGEIIARGANVMKGYWKRPEITAEALCGGWMHTGDIGRFDANGFLYILDRKKDMIKPGGENVYTPEVESMVASHPAVLEVAVIGVPDPTWGETIRAIIALRPGAQLSEAELIEWCRARMTHFKCPTSVVFMDTLPKGGTGKVQKGALRERFGKETARGVGTEV